LFAPPSKEEESYSDDEFEASTDAGAGAGAGAGAPDDWVRVARTPPRPSRRRDAPGAPARPHRPQQQLSPEVLAEAGVLKTKKLRSSLIGPKGVNVKYFKRITQGAMLTVDNRDGSVRIQFPRGMSPEARRMARELGGRMIAAAAAGERMQLLMARAQVEFVEKSEAAKEA